MSVLVDFSHEIPQLHKFLIFLETACHKIVEELELYHGENTYTKCLKIELKNQGYSFDYLPEVPVKYQNQVVGAKTVNFAVHLEDVGKVVIKLDHLVASREGMKVDRVPMLNYFMEQLDADLAVYINFPNLNTRFPPAQDPSFFHRFEIEENGVIKEPLHDCKWTNVHEPSPIRMFLFAAKKFLLKFIKDEAPETKENVESLNEDAVKKEEELITGTETKTEEIEETSLSAKMENLEVK